MFSAVSCVSLRIRSIGSSSIGTALNFSFFAWAATFADGSTTHWRPVVIIAGLFQLPIACQRAWTFLAPTCNVVCWVGATLLLSTRAGAAAIADLGTARQNPVVIVAVLLSFPVASDGAFRIRAPSCDVVLWECTTLLLSLFAWAPALADLLTAHRNPVVIVASLFGFPIADQRACTVVAISCIRVWLIHSSTLALPLLAWAAAFADKRAAYCIPIVIVAGLLYLPVAFHRARSILAPSFVMLIAATPDLLSRAWAAT